MYRVFDPPAGAPSFVAPHTGLRLQRFRETTNPVVVLVGDSIATYNANTTGRGDGLACRLEAWMRNNGCSGLRFYNRSIGGQTYAGFKDSTSTTPLWTDLCWWQDGQTWKEQVKALNPHVIVLAFGMNDGAGIQAGVLWTLLDEIATWPSAPDVVLCSNLHPIFPSGQETPQRSKDKAAGITRSMALYRDVALLDFHQQFCAARDQFDPRSSSTRNAELASVLSTDRRLCPAETIDFIAEFDVDFDRLAADTGQKVITQLGPLSMDWLLISKTAGPLLRFELLAGTGGASPVTYRNCVLLEWPGNGVRTLRVEIKDNALSVYEPNVGGAEGMNRQPLFTSKIIRGGGWFTPSVRMNSGANDLDMTITNVSFWVADQVLHRATITDADLFQGPTGIYEGTFGNHPGNKAGAYIYAPVLAQAFIR